MSGAVPPPAVCPLERAARVPRPVCPGCGRCGRGDPAPVPQPAPLWAGVARCGGGGRASRGGCFPPLGGAPGVRRCPSPGRPSSGAGSQGSASRVSRMRSMRAWGPSTVPTACALAGWRCSLWGWRKGVPCGGAFHRCEGRPGSGAVPSPTARPLSGLLGSATHVSWARVRGCGGPTLSPWPACPVGAACRGGGGGPSPGGVACHRCVGRLVSGAVPPRPPVLWNGQPGLRDPCVPGAVGAGVGTQHRPHSVGPCRLALLAVGVADRGSPGGVLSTVVRGAWRQALSHPRPPGLSSGHSGFRVPCVPGAVGAGAGTKHRPHSVRPYGPALLAVGVAEGCPLWGCLPPL